MKHVALGLLLAVFFSLAGLFVLVGVGVGLAQMLVFPRLDESELPSVQATVERAGRSYSGRRCSYHVYLDQPPRHLIYSCDMPALDAVERALRAPAPAVEAWYEPTLPLPGAIPRLWQLRVEGQTVLAREQVAAVQRARLFPGLAFYLVFLGLGVVLGGIGVGAFLSFVRPRRS
jgi:hypothetical protein